VRVRSRRVVSILFVVALVGTACGARLTAEQRAAGIGGLAQGGATSSVAPGVNPNAAGSSGATTGGAIGGGTGSVAPTASGAAQAGCPSGKGGATDKGVTANQITIATVADVSGVQPGLFRSAWQATSAWAAMVNSQGGICGRTIKMLLLDSQADSTKDRAAVTQACDQAFAMVGSISAFDDGGAPVGQSCGIPDISVANTNASHARATNVYPAYPTSPDYLNSSWGIQIKRKYPAAIKKSAFITLNAGASIQNGNQRIKGLTALGYNFIYKTQVQVLEANYSPYVQAMKSKGVQFVDMLSDYQSIVRLQKAMLQANWFPQVRVWDSVAYSPKYLSEGGQAVEGSLVFLNTALFEEASGNAEMQLYQSWLQRTAPGAAADYFGIYAWSAGRLFEQLAKGIGPDLTRTKLFSALKATHKWDDHGLHTSHDIGNKREGNCTLYVEVKGGRFIRNMPSSGWTCTGALVKT
jgi:ABC-type branched-subunit amino acid transport system substrate-binding protein